MTDHQHRLQIRRLGYFGHIEHMGPARHSHITLHGRVDGVRSKGRPLGEGGWITSIRTASRGGRL